MEAESAERELRHEIVSKAESVLSWYNSTYGEKAYHDPEDPYAVFVNGHLFRVRVDGLGAVPTYKRLLERATAEFTPWEVDLVDQRFGVARSKAFVVNTRQTKGTWQRLEEIGRRPRTTLFPVTAGGLARAIALLVLFAVFLPALLRLARDIVSTPTYR